jgi:hypothetical protein
MARKNGAIQVVRKRSFPNAFNTSAIAKYGNVQKTKRTAILAPASRPSSRGIVLVSVFHRSMV